MITSITGIRIKTALRSKKLILFWYIIYAVIAKIWSQFATQSKQFFLNFMNWDIHWYFVYPAATRTEVCRISKTPFNRVKWKIQVNKCTHLDRFSFIWVCFRYSNIWHFHVSIPGKSDLAKNGQKNQEIDVRTAYTC